MEHLLERTGFVIESVYGDFFRQELRNDSSEMVWVAKLSTMPSNIGSALDSAEKV